MKLPLASRHFAALAVLIPLVAAAAAVPLHAAEPARYTIAARVLSVAADKSTAVINRGKAEAVIPGSPVVIRPNRGNNEADIEWDIAFAKGVVQSVGKDTSVVKLTDVWQDIQERDYCAVDADIPAALRDSDLVRITLYDIALSTRPVALPCSRWRTSSGTPPPGRRRHHRDAPQGDPGDGPRRPGGEVQDRQDQGRALRRDDPSGGLPGRHTRARRKVRRSTPPGSRDAWPTMIGFSSTSMPTGPTEGPYRESRPRRPHQAEPAVQSGDALVAKGQFVESLAEYNKAMLIDPENAGAKTKIETVNRIIERLRILQQDEKDVPTRRGLGLGPLRTPPPCPGGRRSFKKPGALATIRSKPGAFSVSLTPLSTITRRPGPSSSPWRQSSPRTWGSADGSISSGRTKTRARQGPNVGAYMAVGEIKYKSGSYDDAIAEFNKALELAPRDPEVWKRIGQTAVRRRARQEDLWAQDFWQKGEFEAALSRWKTALEDCRLIEDMDGLKTILRGAGAIMYGSGSYDDAIDAYEGILEVDPGDVASHFEIARCHQDKKDYGKAVEWAEKGLAKDPKSAWGYDILGAIHDNAGRIDEAILNYQKSVDIDPFYRDPLYNLGRLSALRADYDKAAGFFRRALEADDEYELARTRLQEVDGLVEAKARLKAAPDDGDAQVRLVNALWGLGDYARAIDVLKQALRSGRDAAWVNEELGHCLIRLGQAAEGKAALEASYRLRPKPDVRAWILYIEAQTRADASPGDPAAELELGRDSLYWQDYDAALKHFGLASVRASLADEAAAGQERARRGQEASRQMVLSSEYYGRGQYEQAVERARQALAAFRDLEARRGQLNSLLRIGWGLSAQFKHREALEAYTEAKTLAETLQVEGLTASVETSLGGHYAGFGEYEKAIGHHRRAQALRRRTNSVLEEAWSVLPSIGWVQSRLGNSDAEISCYEQALAIHRRLIYRRGEASALLSLGSAYQERDEFPKALDAYGKALEIARARSFGEQAVAAYSGLGSIYAAVGDVENARKYLQYYLEEAQIQGLKWQRANALNNLGLLELETVKDYGRAMTYFKDSQTLGRAIGDGRMEGVATANIAVVLSRQGNYREALGLHQEGLRLVREFKDPSLEMQGLNELRRDLPRTQGLRPGHRLPEQGPRHRRVPPGPLGAVAVRGCSRQSL